MTRTRRIALGSLAAVMLIPGLVSAQAKALGLGKNGDVELRAVTTIGPATLRDARATPGCDGLRPRWNAGAASPASIASRQAGV